MKKNYQNEFLFIYKTVHKSGAAEFNSRIVKLLVKERACLLNSTNNIDISGDDSKNTKELF